MTSWSLFLVYTKYYPKISKRVKKLAFLSALTCFSPGVHQISPLFWQFWISNFAIFRRISKLCAFWVYTKNNQNKFSWMLLPSPVVFLEVMVSFYSKHCGSRKSQKKIANFLINTLFFDTKSQNRPYLKVKFRMNARGKYSWGTFLWP